MVKSDARFEQKIAELIISPLLKQESTNFKILFTGAHCLAKLYLVPIRYRFSTENVPILIYFHSKIAHFRLYDVNCQEHIKTKNIDNHLIINAFHQSR